MGVCNNIGWCNQSTGGTAGAPCNADASCPGGTCANMANVTKPACKTDTGSGDLGGCGRHQICAGGTSPGRLCLLNTDCSGGGTCPALVANISTAGQVCYKTESFPPQNPVITGCLPVGNAKRLVGQAQTGNVCP
jgi:hypothetical protein